MTPHLMLFYFLLLQIQRMVETVSECSIHSPNVHPSQQYVDEIPKEKKKQKKNMHNSSNAKSPKHTQAITSPTSPQYSKMNVRLMITVHLIDLINMNFNDSFRSHV